MAWGLLAVAIIVEVVATVSLKLSEGFSHLGWSAVVVFGYLVSFALLGQIVRTIPLAVTYAVWSGAGTALTAALSLVLFGERMTALKLAGFGLIVVGVAILNVETAE
ncbi:MAG: DMT family transporter [Actinomycetes bacterium]